MKVAMKLGAVVAVFLAVVAACHAADTPSTLPAVWVADQSASVQTFPADALTVVRLDNGMKVIVKEVHTAPIVHVRCFVNTGSIYEIKWTGTGVSHLLEHLVAEGAEHDMGGGPKAPGQKKVDRITRIGGQSNAYTSLDHTVYYIEASSAKAMECVDLVADWMANPQITRDSFTREHGVVQRELEMGKAVADRQFGYATMANVFGDHPAGVPTIGFKPALAKLTYQDVLDYHAATYVPQNMTFVVVGDVKTADVLARIRKNLGGFKAGRLPDHRLPPVEPISGVRRMVVPNPAVREVSEEIAFASIPLQSEDLYALDLLSTVMGESQSSRLFRNVYRKQNLVTSISSVSWTPAWGRGVFEISFRAEPQLADAAEAAIINELRAVADNGVDQQELARAKRQKIAEFVFGQQSVEQQAATLGSDLMSTGDINFSQRYVQRIQAVTAQQLQAMARKYFKFDDMAVTRMVPAGPQAATAATQQATQYKAEVFTLPNGLRVVLKNTQPATGASGVVSMVLAARGGLMLDTPKTNGMGMLMAELSTKGAGQYTAEDIAGFFDQAGGSIDGNCGNNSFYWQASVLQDSFDKALEIFAQVVERPTFPQKELDLLRPQMIASIGRIDADWQSQMMRFFRQKFFTGSPFAMLASGSVDVVQASTVEQIKAYHQANIRAGSCTLAIYGQFDMATTRKAVEKLFADLPKGQVKMPAVPVRKVSAAGELHVLPTEKEVAAITVGAPGMTIMDLEDRVPMDVLDTIISGYQLPSGWLHEELRGGQLVYVVHAYNFLGLAPGAFVAYAAGQPANQQEVLNVIVRDLNKAANYLPTQAEIDEAVNTILTADALDNQTPASLAMQAALDELWGFGYDIRIRMDAMYRKVTPADVQRVGRKYLGKGYVVTVTSPDTKAIHLPTKQELESKAPETKSAPARGRISG